MTGQAISRCLTEPSTGECQTSGGSAGLRASRWRQAPKLSEPWAYKDPTALKISSLRPDPDHHLTTTRGRPHDPVVRVFGPP